jgi:hypothetical protein
MKTFKEFFLESKQTWCAIILDEESKQKLLKEFKNIIPKGWIIFCNHMTIDDKKPIVNENELGKVFGLTVMSLAYSNEYLAVKVSGYQRQDGNDFTHVTIAEPSKELQSEEHPPLKFKPINKTIILSGTVENINEDRKFL